MKNLTAQAKFTELDLLKALIKPAELTSDLCDGAFAAAVGRAKERGLEAFRQSAKSGDGGGGGGGGGGDFERYKRLMSRYDGFARSFGASGHALLQGVAGVMRSRVELFAENGGNENENPIAAEERAITETFAAEWAKSFDDRVSAFYAEKSAAFKSALTGLSAAAAPYEAFCAAFDGFFEKLRQQSANDIAEDFNQAAEGARERLSDASFRPALEAFGGIMRQEIAILDDFTGTQTTALEAALDTAEGEEPDTLLLAVYAIKEADDEFNASGEDFSPKTSENAANVDVGQILSEISGADCLTPETFAAFTSAIGEAASDFEESAAAKIAITVKRLEIIAKRKYAYKFSRVIFEEVSTATALIDAFARICAAYGELCAGAGPVGGGDVAKGINETITIKVEALKEAAAAFEDEAKLEADFEPAELSEDVRKTAFALLVEKTAGITSLDKDSLQTMRRAIAEAVTEAAAELEENLSKEGEARLARLTAQAAAFKSEQILYEVGTFEEIIAYSVPRLREGANEAEQAYAAAIDREHDNISRVLSEAGVEVIRPNPGDPFNGREHEALMAETGSAFKKGEIIKVINNGYRHNGAVLVRATVIAAR